MGELARVRGRDGRRIRPARGSDLAYIEGLLRRDSNALGFCPRAALLEKIALQRIWIAQDNGEPAGFLHHGSLAGPEVRIFQAAIQYDARRRQHGLDLVQHLVRRAAAAGATSLSLRCLSHLQANEFWPAAGFRLVGQEPGGRARGYPLNVWLHRSTAGASGRGAAPTPHQRVHPCPRCGRPTPDAWGPGARRYRCCAACLAIVLSN